MRQSWGKTDWLQERVSRYQNLRTGSEDQRRVNLLSCRSKKIPIAFWDLKWPWTFKISLVSSSLLRAIPVQFSDPILTQSTLRLQFFFGKHIILYTNRLRILSQIIWTADANQLKVLSVTTFGRISKGSCDFEKKRTNQEYLKSFTFWTFSTVVCRAELSSDFSYNTAWWRE